VLTDSLTRRSEPWYSSPRRRPSGHPSPEAVEERRQLIPNETPAPLGRSLRAFAAGLPKAEVHVHLEGCFELADIQDLARAAGEPLLRPASQLFRFDGLADFLRFLTWQCGLVRTRTQVSQAAYRFAQREAAAGVVYADLIINPKHWSAWHDRLGGLLEALDDGLTCAEHDGLARVGVCVSLSREQTSASASELVERLIELRHPRVVALSIDGNEETSGRTGSRFADAFARARSAGFRTTVHAGESSGPEGVRDAIEFLGADRIDHGFRAIEDPSLVKELADRGIPLGLCPWSNIELGHFPDRSSHPLDKLRRAGVAVSINTDDPALFGVTLDDEYVATAAAYAWTPDTLAAVSRVSISASFCDDSTKRDLLRKHEKWLADGAGS
jgi:adenosine deaminase